MPGSQLDDTSEFNFTRTGYSAGSGAAQRRIVATSARWSGPALRMGLGSVNALARSRGSHVRERDGVLFADLLELHFDLGQAFREIVHRNAT